MGIDIYVSNRTAKCCICRQIIPKGEKKVSCNLGSGYYDSQYHVKCFLERYEDVLRELMKLSSQEITGHPMVVGNL